MPQRTESLSRRRQPSSLEQIPTITFGQEANQLVPSGGLNTQNRLQTMGRPRDRELFSRERELSQDDQQRGLLADLERVRGGINPLLSARAQEVFQTGRRRIGQEEARRLRQTRSSLGSLGLSGTPVELAMERAERERTGEQEQELSGAISIQELTSAFQEEQAAIDRLYQSGETALAFQRQRELVQMQIDAQIRLSREGRRGGALSAIGRAIGDAIGVITGLGVPQEA